MANDIAGGNSRRRQSVFVWAVQLEAGRHSSHTAEEDSGSPQPAVAQICVWQVRIAYVVMSDAKNKKQLTNDPKILGEIAQMEGGNMTHIWHELILTRRMNR